MAEGYGEQFVFLAAPKGYGKSHLLQGVCHHASFHQVPAVYIPLADHAMFSPKILEGLESLSLICLDDIDAIAGNPAWEEALFHLYNKVRDKHKRLLVAAEQLPTSLPFGLADLKSRLTWGISFQLHELGDDDKLIALQIHSKARGLELEESVGRFLLKRCPRDLDRLFSTLAQLDHASLAEQRRLTIPFVKQVLSL